MELFLLIAIGITAISFISIALTKPSPVALQELKTEPTHAELITPDEAMPRDSSTDLQGINPEEEELELVGENAMAQMA